MSRPDAHVWDAILAHLRRHHPGICRHWFDDIEPLDMSGGVLRLLVREVVQLKYLQRTCVPQFTEAAQAATGALMTVRFVGEAEASHRPRAGGNGRGAAQARPAAAEPAPANGWSRPAPLYGMDEAMVLSPDYSFETFVIGPGNRLAHAAARAVAETPGKAYNPLFVHGGVGLGKTHVLQAICLELLRRDPNTRLHYTSCDEFMTQYHESVQAGKMSEFRHRYRNVDVLVVDDIHDLSRQDRSQEEFFHTFNALHQSGRQIVLSSDAPPDEIPDLEERLASRFSSSMVAELEKPTFEMRLSIVRSKAELRNVKIPDDVAFYVASRVDTNIRELEGVIVRLQAVSNLNEAPITIELARTVLGDPAPNAAASSMPNVQTILETVAAFYDLRVSDMLSRRRHKSVALPRQVGMWLTRRLTRFSLEEIGGYFGGRDHTTVMHAIRTIDGRREQDATMQQSLERLEARVKGHGSDGAGHAPGGNGAAPRNSAPEIEVLPPSDSPVPAERSIDAHEA